MTVIEHWDDDHCPKSRNDDGSHCAHVDTHDVCDWCGAHWGEGGAMTVPVEQLQGAVARIAELEAEIERRRGDYIAGHVDGYRTGSTSSLANPGAVGA